MTWLHDASTPSLQDQQMVGAICGLEDFLSNVNIFCLQALLPGHRSINVLQLALKPTLEPGCSRGSDVLTTRESRKSVAAPQPISGKELDTIRTLPLPEQMFSRAAPHLHNRSAPLWRAQTDCV